jgi:arabinofuranan 3-O-arabinosyltransferase
MATGPTEVRSGRPGERALLAALAALSYGLAFLQRAGETVSDTRLELSVDPGLFLERSAYIWSTTTDLGHVQSGQFTGYLFPMGPWFALGDWLGLPMWVTQRLWLGTLLLFAGWGVIRLMRALHPAGGRVAEAAAALVFVLSPYVVLYTSRGTVTLLAYAALPWLMLAVHRGLREPRGWLWPAAIGLLLAASGGGVNAAVIALALLGPLALLAYELLLGDVSREAAWSFAWRAALAGALASAWWAVPLVIQSGYGADFLLFTEHPRSIWATTSLPELLRQLGFWGLYVGVGFGKQVPFMEVASTYLYSVPVILATFALPLLAVLSFRTARAWRYAAFFLALAVLTLVVMFAGFPDGTRLRAALIDLYNNLAALQFLRTTYKAAPVLVLSFACLIGAGVASFTERARRGALRVAGRRVPAVALAGLVALPVVAALPLFTTRAIDSEQAYGHVPSWWERGLADADAAQPPGTRTMVVPGELFGWYRWGGTTSPVAPAVSRRPVAIREIVPYADPRSAQLQIAVDDLVQQARLVPGQLAPLLRLMDVGQVLVPTDSVTSRSGATDPARVERTLAGQPGLDRSVESYGPRRRFAPPSGRGGAPVTLPSISRRVPPGAPAPGGARLHPTAGATLLSGDAEGVPLLAAAGLLDASRALFYDADLGGEELRRAVRDGARLVFSDSARRRVFVSSRTRANRGPTLGQADPIPPDYARFETFPETGTGGQTVALYSGARRVFSPVAGVSSIFPQYRAYAALDGRPETAWLADENLPPRDWYLEIELKRARDLDAIEIVPHRDRTSRTVEVGVSVDGGAERRVALRPGSNRVPLGEPSVRTLRVRILRVEGPEKRRFAGGIDELRIPGVRVRERLRLPSELARRTSGLDLTSNEIDVVLERTTADFPYRAGADRYNPTARVQTAMVDAEPGLERELTLPAGRDFALSGWASAAPDAPDSALDRLAGLAAGWRFRSSSRFEGVPGMRASSAFDGDPATSWAGDVAGGRGAWIELRAARPLRVDRFRLTRGPAAYAFPARVKVSSPGRTAVVAPVTARGEVELPAPVRTRSLRIEVLAVRPRGRVAARRRLHAVAVAEVELPGLRPPAPRRHGAFGTACGELLATSGSGGASIPMRVSGTIAELDAGAPLRLRGCAGGRLALPRGRSLLSVPPGAMMRADQLLLRSRAPRPAADAPRRPRVTASSPAGAPGQTGRARLRPDGPGWLVLTQSYSRGWRAWCSDSRGRERELGEPLPIDGYANGWRVQGDCVEARFGFAPQTQATASFALSGATALGLLGILLVSGGRRRRPAHAMALAPAAAGPDNGRPFMGERAWPDPLVRLGWLPALLVSGTIGAIGAVLFALRMGPALAVLSLLLLRAGVNVRRLVALAAALIALLPAIYIAFPPADKGGFSFTYATDVLFAHWVAVVAVSALAAAATLACLRRPPSARPPRRPSPEAAPPAARSGSSARPAGGGGSAPGS